MKNALRDSRGGNPYHRQLGQRQAFHAIRRQVLHPEVEHQILAVVQPLGKATGLLPCLPRNSMERPAGRNVSGSRPASTAAWYRPAPYPARLSLPAGKPATPWTDGSLSWGCKCCHQLFQPVRFRPDPGIRDRDQVVGRSFDGPVRPSLMLAPSATSRVICVAVPSMDCCSARRLDIVLSVLPPSQITTSARHMGLVQHAEMTVGKERPSLRTVIMTDTCGVVAFIEFPGIALHPSQTAEPRRILGYSLAPGLLGCRRASHLVAAVYPSARGADSRRTSQPSRVSASPPDNLSIPTRQHMNPDQLDLFAETVDSKPIGPGAAQSHRVRSAGPGNDRAESARRQDHRGGRPTL